jgi:hypothetical protein
MHGLPETGAPKLCADTLQRDRSEGGQTVPVLAVIELPGGSSELDEVFRAAWDLGGNPPTGNRLRLAGPMHNGWRVVSLWDSRELFQSFMQERLHMTLDDLGGQQPTITLWEIEHMHGLG